MRLREHTLKTGSVYGFTLLKLVYVAYESKANQLPVHEYVRGTPTDGRMGYGFTLRGPQTSSRLPRRLRAYSALPAADLSAARRAPLRRHGLGWPHLHAAREA